MSIVMRSLLSSMQKTIGISTDFQNKAIKYNSKLKKYRMDELAKLGNVILYIDIAVYDIQVFLNQIVVENDENIKKSYCKHISTIIFEIFDDFNSLYTKEIREIINKYLSREEFNEINEISKQINGYRRKNHNKFKEIRNTVAAHKDLNGLKQVSVISKIDCDKIEQVAKDVINLLYKLSSKTRDTIMQYTSSILNSN